MIPFFLSKVENNFYIMRVHHHEGPLIPYAALELGPLRGPGVTTTLTNLLLYCVLRLARPVFGFFFSCASTFGVCPLTFPARASDPWTLPPRSLSPRKSVEDSLISSSPNVCSSSRGRPANVRTCCSYATPLRKEMSSFKSPTVMDGLTS